MKYLQKAKDVIMKRYPMKLREIRYNQQQFYRLCPVYYKQIAPGERVSSLDVNIMCQSKVFNRRNLSPALAQVWAFYVPHRLTWAEWVDFIALSDDSPPTHPTVALAQADPRLYEKTDGVSALPRWAFKLIANQYFLPSNEVLGSYPAPFNVTSVTDGQVTASGSNRLLQWEQLAAHLRADTTYTASTYSIPSTPHQINMDQFAALLRDNRARRRAVMSGDKYIDIMRSMGVELDWRIQMAPEFLGVSQQVVYPRDLRSTSPDPTAEMGTVPDGLRFRAMDYNYKVQMSLRKPKVFAEHGLLVVLMALRPSVAYNRSPMAARLIERDDYWRPDIASGPIEGGGATEPLTPNRFGDRFLHYRLGENITGFNDQGAAFNFSGTNPIYIDPADFDVFALPGETSGDHYAFFADLSIRGLTPVPPNRV